MRSWVARLVAAGYVTSTMGGVFNTCAQVFAQAVDDGVIARSPCAGVSLPEDRRREETHFLTPEQVADLADAIHPRFRALVYTAAYTGLPGSLRPALGLLLVTKVRSEPCALKCRLRALPARRAPCSVSLGSGGMGWPISSRILRRS